jgi:hypothetical protein
VCETVELKDELLEDVPPRVRLRECLRECRSGLEEMACSESPDSEEFEDLGGDASEGMATRSYGLRVRRIGPLLSILPLDPVLPFVFDGEPSFVFFGSVRAQFSQGMALFLSFSS